MAEQISNFPHAVDVIKRLTSRLKKAIIGRDKVIELIIVAMLSDGHVLLEDYPGSGKTTLAKALGDSIIDDLPDDDIPSFRRIQFTPDLLPSDVTGLTIFDSDTNSFHFKRGPVFAYILLADEINRTSPKVQAAMLEAMAEKQVTIDNASYALDDLFFVIATQNPKDLAGTFPLPVAQLDRFLFKIRMDYIERDDEIAVLNTQYERLKGVGDELPRVRRAEIVDLRDVVRNEVYFSPKLNETLVDVARGIREHPSVSLGVSTRSLVLMKNALQAAALLDERDYVTADDIEFLAPYVFSHRMELLPGEDDADEVVRQALVDPLEKLAKKILKRTA